jgi:TRAP-type C4-dicarboxylate transport system substrate-binding protein
MKLRGKITVLLVSLMMLFPLTISAAETIKLFIAGTSGAEDTQSMGHFEFAKRLAAESNNVFKPEVKINAVMGETDDVTEQAIQGVPVINATDPGRLAAYVPEFGLIQMPYLLPDYTYLNKIMDTKLYAKWDKAFQEKGLKLVTSNGYSGVRSWVTNFPVRTPADLKGVKIRTIGSDLFVNSVNAMGAIATALPWAETYQGIEQGVVDGCEAQIPGIYSMRFYEVRNHVSLSEHFTLIAAMVTGTKFFDSIPAEYQTILLKQAYEAYKDNQSVVVSKSDEYIKEMETKGVTFVKIDKTPFVEAVQPVYEKMNYSKLRDELYAELGL